MPVNADDVELIDMLLILEEVFFLRLLEPFFERPFAVKDSSTTVCGTPSLGAYTLDCFALFNHTSPIVIFLWQDEYRIANAAIIICFSFVRCDALCCAEVDADMGGGRELGD